MESKDIHFRGDTLADVIQDLDLKMYLNKLETLVTDDACDIMDYNEGNLKIIMDDLSGESSCWTPAKSCKISKQVNDEIHYACIEIIAKSFIWSWEDLNGKR